MGLERKRLPQTGPDSGKEREGLYFRKEQRPDCFSTGCTLLDCALGGGWARNRIINVVGDKSTGKSLLAIEACANFRRALPAGKIFYIESEAAFDEDFAATLGLPKGHVEFPIDIFTVEDLFKKLEEITTKAKEDTLVIVDSLDALSDQAELEKEINAGSFGAAKAKKLSELFRRLVQKIESKKVTLIIVSQVREAIGVMFGKSQTRSGGRALDFYASQILWLYPQGKLKKTRDGIERVIGIKINAKVEKNKIGMPWREAAFPIYFNYGVEDVIAGLEFLDKFSTKDDVAGEPIKKVIASLHKFSTDEYSKLRKLVSKEVKATWDSIEDKFDPKRRKYE